MKFYGRDLLMISEGTFLSTFLFNGILHRDILLLWIALGIFFFIVAELILHYKVNEKF